MKKLIALTILFGWIATSFGMGNPTHKSKPRLKRIFAEKTDKGVVDFGLETIDGDTLILSEVDADVILLIFWSPFCGHCRHEIPDILKLEKKYGDRLKVIGIGMWATPKQIKALSKQFKIDFDVCIYDTVLQRVPDFRIRGVPTMFLLDKNRVLKDMILGRVPMNVLEDRLKKVLGVTEQKQEGGEKDG